MPSFPLEKRLEQYSGAGSRHQRSGTCRRSKSPTRRYPRKLVRIKACAMNYIFIYRCNLSALLNLHSIYVFIHPLEKPRDIYDCCNTAIPTDSLGVGGGSKTYLWRNLSEDCFDFASRGVIIEMGGKWYPVSLKVPTDEDFPGHDAFGRSGLYHALECIGPRSLDLERVWQYAEYVLEMERGSLEAEAQGSIPVPILIRPS